MYTLLTKDTLRTSKVINKSVKQKSNVLHDLTSLLLIPESSRVIIFFDNSINIAHLKDLENALNLDITIVVPNDNLLKTVKELFINVVRISWEVIDGDLIDRINYRDVKEPQRSTYSKASQLEEDARRLVSSGPNEATKLLASAYLNLLDSIKIEERNMETKEEEMAELRYKNESLSQTLDLMSKETMDLIETYKTVQTKFSSRDMLDVIKDNNHFNIPADITSLVIKNYGLPYLNRFVMALKDVLTTSFDLYTKVLYIVEPDGVSLQEINRNKFYLMDGAVKGSEILKNDLLLCVGNVKNALEFLTTSSSINSLIIIDSRRTMNHLITGQTLTMYAAQDIETATNLGLDAGATITASKRSKYHIKESEFAGKKSYATRNNNLVMRVANTLVGGGNR